MTEELFGPLFDEEQPNKAVKKHPALPHLTSICSLSTALRAEEFFDLVKRHEITLLLDTRLSPSYKGAGFADGKDLPYFARLHGIEYFHAPTLAPTKEIRSDLDATFKSIKSAPDRDPTAWTRFLEDFETLMLERKPVRSEEIQQILRGHHSAVAVLCACQHHDDCHRSYVCGMLVRCFEGLELKILYPKKPPSPSYPRRYRLHDFPNAGLLTNVPKSRR